MLTLLILPIGLTIATIEVCLGDWGKILSNVYDNLHSPYTQMLYYTGKNLNDLGRYHACTQLSESKYALLEFYKPPWFVIALCGPKSCSKSDYHEIINSNTNFVNIYLSSVIPNFPNNSTNVYFPHEEQASLDIDSGRVLMLVLVILLVLMGILGTTVSISYKNRKFSGYEYFQCFSLYDNLKGLSLRSTDERMGDIRFDILDGIRVMCLGWVVLGHVVMQISIYSVIANIFNLETIISRLNITVIYGGYYAVDTNFWISGFLSSFIILKLLDSDNFSWAAVYTHRYIRITILFFFTMTLFWSFEKYMGTGPLWFLSGQYSRSCSDYWWTTLFYLNNFVPDFRGNSCSGVGWFLAEDMQFFLVTPPIIYIYHKHSKKWGWVLICAMVLMSVISSAVVAEVYQLNMVMISEEDRNLNEYYYVKPYCRATPYAFGIMCGIFMNHAKDREYVIRRAFRNKRIRWGMLIGGFVVINFLIFVQYSAYSEPGSDFRFRKWTQAENTAWITLNKLLFSAAISAVLLPCLLGYFSWIRKLLAYPMWAPFAKLTFGVYLIHLYVIDIIYKSQQTSLYFDQLTIVSNFIPVLALCYIIALPIVIFVEIPCAKMEKVVNRKRSAAGKTKEVG